MADFHLDQNTAPSLAIALIALGHSAVTAGGLGMRQARDAEHLLHAAQHSRTVLTRDRDFLELHVAWLDWAAAWGVSPAPEHAGILVIPSTWTVPFAASQINTFLLGNSRTSNTLYEYDAVRGWVRFR